MKIRKETRRMAKKLFRGCWIQERFNEERVRQLISSIAKEKPRYYLALLTEIEKLAKIELQKRTLFVETAKPIANGQIDEIQSLLQKRSPSPLISKHRVNPSLIGGLRIKVGSDVWDGSIAARLKQLRIEN